MLQEEHLFHFVRTYGVVGGNDDFTDDRVTEGEKNGGATRRLLHAIRWSGGKGHLRNQCFEKTTSSAIEMRTKHRRNGVFPMQVTTQKEGAAEPARMGWGFRKLGVKAYSNLRQGEGESSRNQARFPK